MTTLHRPVIERAIEALIELLDWCDGDSDQEPDESDVEHDGSEPPFAQFYGDFLP